MPFIFDLPPIPPALYQPAQSFATGREVRASKEMVMTLCATGQYDYVLAEVNDHMIRFECDPIIPPIKAKPDAEDIAKEKAAKEAAAKESKKKDLASKPLPCTDQERLLGLCEIDARQRYLREQMLKLEVQRAEEKKKAEEEEARRKASGYVPPPPPPAPYKDPEGCLKYRDIGLVPGDTYDVGGTKSMLFAISRQGNELILNFVVERGATSGEFARYKDGSGLAYQVMAARKQYAYTPLLRPTLSEEIIEKLCLIQDEDEVRAVKSRKRPDGTTIDPPTTGQGKK
jgi:hypothetical protein